MFCFEGVADDSNGNQKSVSIESFKEKIRNWEPSSWSAIHTQSRIRQPNLTSFMIWG